MTSLITLHDYERAALERLDDNARGYFASGSDDERTLVDNQAAYGRHRLVPRVMVGVGHRDVSTAVLGTEIAMPIVIAPMAMQGMAHDAAERGMAGAARSADTVMVLSTISNTPIEDVVAARKGPVWFQLYVFQDRGATADLVRRAEAAGVEALVVTVDVPVLGQREADLRNQFTMPAHLSLPNVPDGGAPMTKASPGAESALNAYAHCQLDPDLSWSDINWLRTITSLPIVVKGVMHPDDARLAFGHGASAVVVSNHGGRQLDTVPATIDVLEAVVDAVADAGEVYVDGGIRRGTDVIKALAMGARAVWVGRPLLWGLTVNGEAGATDVLRILHDEFDRAMALCGCRTVGEIGPSLMFGAD